jgi:hypothetical protein
MIFKLALIGKQHDELGLTETLERLLQISPLTHAKKLLHADALPLNFMNNLLYGKNRNLSRKSRKKLIPKRFCPDKRPVPSPPPYSAKCPGRKRIGLCYQYKTLGSH